MTFSTTSHITRLLVFTAFFAAISGAVLGQTLDQAVQGFVSIEPYEIRQTFVVRLSVLDPELAAGIPEIRTADHQAILTAVQNRLSGKSRLRLDGSDAPIEFEPERSEFIRSDPELSIVTDDRELIPINEAVIAVVFAASRPGFPRDAAIAWDVFPEGVDEVPLTFRSPSDNEKFTLTREQPSVTWEIPETESLPRLEKLPLPPAHPRLSVPLLSITFGIIAMVIAVLSRRLGERTPAAFGLLILVCVVAAIATWKIGRLDIAHPFKKAPPVSAEQADEITYALLINLYHAFDFREESAIYDTLEQSASGDLLEKIYLEIRRSLTLEDQGGAKVRINNVDLRRCLPEPLSGDDAVGVDPRGFRADCEWVAIGDVTHWAHTHTRLNRYGAELSIAPIDGAWKMIDLEILEEFSEVKKKEEESDQ